MNNPAEHRTAALEARIDSMLSDGRIHIMPPGFMVFVLVNILIIVAVAMLVITAQEVLFTDQKQQAAVFSVVSGIILTFVVVTPAFLVLRGIAPAVTYFKIVIGLLLLLIVGFGLGAFIKNGSVNIFSSIGLVAVVVSYWLVRSDAYQLLHIFTVRRRLMAEQDLERKKQLHSN